MSIWLGHSSWHNFNIMYIIRVDTQHLSLGYLLARFGRVTQFSLVKCKWNSVRSVFVFLIKMNRLGWHARCFFLLHACHKDVKLAEQQPYCDSEVTTIKRKADNLNMTEQKDLLDSLMSHCTDTGQPALDFWLCEEKSLVYLTCPWSEFLTLAAECTPMDVVVINYL